MKATKFLALLIAIVLGMALFTSCSKSTPTSQNVTATPPTDTSTASDATSADATSADYEAGTNAADDIVKTTFADKVLLVVSFGTSFNQSRALTIGGIEAAMKEAYPDYQVRRAFSSQIIIDKLASRDGLRIDNVKQALDRMILDGVKDVVIQPTTVMEGIEYNSIVDTAMQYTDKFDSLRIGLPLLDSDADFVKLADISVGITSQYRAADTAIVFMGHGTSAPSNSDYASIQNALTSEGYNDYIVGTVEGTPTLDDVRADLKQMGVHKVVLRDLMEVAGDHANNDMAGDGPDSWKSILTADGYEVTTVIEGLGQVPAIQDWLVSRTKDAMNSTNLSTKDSATASAAADPGLTANRIKDGTYSITVDTGDSMFRAVDCQLTVKGDTMTAAMTLSGTGFSHIYMGIGEQAAADTEDHLISPQVVNDRNVFTFTLSGLDKRLDCSGQSARETTWYDHVVTFQSSNIPADAILPAQIDVTLTGGSGKSTVQSPATLTYKDASNWAEIVWSSASYTYMIVDGTQYNPTNTDGNSTFEIPVKLDTDMQVKANTVAMSTPHEIDYTLHFDSSSIKTIK